MLIINAIKKTEHGKSASRRLRIKNKFPGILYGMNKAIFSIELDHDLLFNLQKKNEFYKDNLCLIIQDKKYIVKVKAIQRHSFKLRLLHIDFIYI